MGDVVAIVAGAVPRRAHEGFVATAHQAGYAPALITTQEALGGARYDVRSLFSAVGVVQDLRAPELIAECARKMGGDRLAALLSWSDSTMVATAYAAERLGVARTPADGLARARNKYAMRRALRAAGLPSPPFALLSGEDEVDRVAREVGFPAIIKPVNGSGSALVRRVESSDDLRRAYRELLAGAPHAVGGALDQQAPVPGGDPLAATSQFLVERVLTGIEYDAEIAVHGGRVSPMLVYRVLAQEGTYFGYGFAHLPADPPAERRVLVETAVEQAVLALGIDNTTVNATVIDDAVLGPTVVELNAGRFGGQMVWRLVQDLTGVDLQAQNLALAVGEPPPLRLSPPEPVPYAALSVFAEQPGEVVAAHGLDELRAHPNVAYVAPFVEPGDVVAGDHVVYAVNAMVLGVDTYEDLVELHGRLTRLVRVETRPVEVADPS